MANNRKRILDRFRKAEERRQQIYDLVAGAFGFKRIKVHSPKSDDLVFGYFQSSCEVLAVDNAWGFEIHKNGQMIFRHDRRPPDWKFKKELYHLPKEAIIRLQDFLRPLIPTFQDFVMHTEYLGLDGYDDNFYFLGYDFSAWCIVLRQQEKLKDYAVGSDEYLDYQQDLTIRDLFQKGCDILHDYGFDITLDGLQTM